MNLTEQLRTNLKKYREATHLTTSELARRSGVSRAHIWQLERGQSVPTIEIVEHLAMGLGVTIEILLGLNGKESMLRLEEEQLAWLLSHKEADIIGNTEEGYVEYVTYFSPMHKARYAEETAHDE